MRKGWLLAAVLLAGVATARTPEGFERVLYEDWRLMLKDAHAAYARDDFATALPMYARNACAGDKSSQFALGSMYLHGQGVAADGLEAYAWYKVAAETREPHYARALEQLESLIPEQHREAADARAAQYLAAYGLKGANVSCRKRAAVGTKIARIECKPPLDMRDGYVEVRMCETDSAVAQLAATR